MKTKTVNFLDYQIVNTGNSDGWVLGKFNTHFKVDGSDSYQCHLGNFSDLETAKKWAVWNFMIARPSVFHASVIYRLNGGTGAYHEWFTFKEQIEKENIEMPKELKCSKDGNFGIAFNGKRI